MSDPVNYVLINSLGQEYAFSNAWMPQVSPAITGYTVTPLYQRPGGMAAGDSEIGPRKITLEWTDVKEDPADYIAALNSIRYVARDSARPCYIEERRAGYRQEVVREMSGDQADEGMYRHSGKKTVSFHLLGGNWETIDEEFQESSDWMASGESLVVNNPELEDVDCLITVIPQTTLATFTITNTANQNGLTIANNSFRPGKTITIDGRDDGQVRMNGVNIKLSLAIGSTFIRLAPGNNPLLYESTEGGAKLQVTFRPEREEI
ncbi:MAG: hypothetical protein E6R03_01555 [Hyphomicrobiaceae bacterium]|nr:MAG: hypothetical protein E6R03_01555 [Hyphomicrobiaceae bacterium]